MNKKFLSFLVLGLLTSISLYSADSDELVAARAAESNQTQRVSPGLAALLAAETVEWGNVLRAIDLPTRGQGARTEVSSVQGGKKKKGPKTPIVSISDFYAQLDGEIKEAEANELPKETLELLLKEFQRVASDLNKIKKTTSAKKFPLSDANKLTAYDKAVKRIQQILKDLNKKAGDTKAAEREAQARALAKIEAEQLDAAKEIVAKEIAEKKALEKHTQQWKKEASDATPMAEEMVKYMTGEAALNLMYIQSISFFGAENQKDQAVPFKEDFEKMTRCIMDWKSNPHMEITVHACPVCGSVNEKPCTIRNAMEISENVRTKYSRVVLKTIIDMASDKAKQNCLVIERLKEFKDLGAKSTRSFQLYIQLLEKLCQDNPSLQMKHIGYLSLLANTSIGVPFEHATK